jgi:hypothetical protein
MKLIAGLTLGSWTLLKPDTTRPYHWQCQCSCGTPKSVRNSSLLSRKSTSCGCARSQALSNRKTHGMTDSVEYRTWQWMWDRVRHKPGYQNISVCPRWQEFENFYSDMGPRPEGKSISLDRVDNAKGYEKINCRWATPTMQNRNKGNTVLIESSQFGTSRTHEEWAAILLEHTSDTNWNARKLKTILSAPVTIDQLLKGLEITDISAEYAHDTDDRELIAA